MAANTVTGKGKGSAKTLTGKELAILANAPSILITGTAHSDASIASPPSTGNTLRFPEPLAGSHENYVVMLTTQNGGKAYTTDMFNDQNGNFIGFSFTTEVECTIMYMVSKIGTRPTF